MSDLNREFQAYLRSYDTKRDTERTAQSRDALFAEFLEWRDRQEEVFATNEAEAKSVTRSKSRR